jgi:hypothetical protein
MSKDPGITINSKIFTIADFNGTKIWDSLLSFQRLLLETKSDSSGYATPPSGGLTTATFIEEFGVTTAFDGNP